MSKTSSDNQTLDPLVTLFMSMGLTKAKATEAIKAPKSATILKEIIESHSDELTGLEEKQATLIVNFSVSLSKAGSVGQAERDYILKNILNSNLKSVDQISGVVIALLLRLLLQNMFLSCCQIFRITSISHRRGKLSERMWRRCVILNNLSQTVSNRF